LAVAGSKSDVFDDSYVSLPFTQYYNCAASEAGQLLDVDDWTDGINFQWNDIEVTGDTGVTDPKSHLNERGTIEYQSANNTRTKKQLTLDINAAPGAYMV
jgi:hypothetical protein